MTLLSGIIGSAGAPSLQLSTSVITSSANSAGGGWIVSRPGTVLLGDICVAMGYTRGGSGNYFATVGGTFGSGFTTINQWQQGDFSGVYGYKIINDAFTLSTGLSSNNFAYVAMFFRPSTGEITNVAISNNNTQYTTGNPSAQTVNASTLATPTISIGFGISTGSVSLSTTGDGSLFTFDNLDFFGVAGAQFASYIHNAVPVNNPTFDIGDGGSDNRLSSFALTLT
jgi:hypothetical protein